MLIDILAIFEEAFSINPKASISAYQKSYSEISKGLSGFTQLMWTKSAPHAGRFDVFVRVLFRDMGQFIEEGLQPYLLFVNNLQRIIEGKSPKYLKLGVVVDTLIEKNPNFKMAYFNHLFDIPISQWRNIAQHMNFKVRNDIVEIWYGSNSNNNKVFSREELVTTIETINTLLYLNKIAFTLISLDYENYIDISKEVKEKNAATTGDDSLIQITESAYAHGFKMINFDLPEKIMIFDTIAEITENDLTHFLKIVVLLLNTDFFARVMDNNEIIYDAVFTQKQLSIFKYG